MKLDTKKSELAVCPVCYTNEIQPNEKPVAKGTIELACKHRFCHECVRLHLQTKISERTIELSCLQAGCKKEISEADLEIIFQDEPDFLSRRRKVTMKRLDEMNPMLRYCQSCSWKIYLKDPNQKSFCCGRCNAVMCGGCKNIQHPGSTCEQNQENEF